MKQTDRVSIGDIYGSMLNDVKKSINESSTPPIEEKLWGWGEKKKPAPDYFGNPVASRPRPTPTKPFEEPKTKDSNGTGPEDADGYNKIVDEEDAEDVSKYLPTSKRSKRTAEMDKKSKDSSLPEHTRKDLKKQCDLRSGEEAEEDEELKESKKVSKKILNNFMSKSSFDKLYSKVLRENFGQENEGEDLDALGLDDATPDSDLDEGLGDDEFGGEEDSVTFTLDRATAQALVDVLQGALGGEEEGFGEEGDDLSFDDEGDLGGEEGGDEFSFDEDEEVQGTSVAPDKKKAFQAKSNKVGGKVVPHKKKASSAVTDDVGDDGDYGHAITSGKKPDMGTDNKVKSTIKGKGQEFIR